MSLQYPPFATNHRIKLAAQSAPWMKWGETGRPIAILQSALITIGYPMPISTRKSGLPDGIYGKETHAVVLGFQTDQ